MLAAPLERLVRDFRYQSGGTPDAELVAAIEAIARLARVERRTRDLDTASAVGTCGTAVDDPSVMLGTVNTATAAEHLGITTRAVTARCQRGTLSACKVDDTWRVWLPDNNMTGDI